MKKIYFMGDNALKTKKKILVDIYPSHFLYGGIELERRGNAKILNYTIKNIVKLRQNDVVITNRLKHVLLMKLLGVKVVLINMNSNHDLSKYPGIRNGFRYWLYKEYYPLCDAVICLSKTQVKKLKKIGVKNIYVVPLGVDQKRLKNIKLKNDYFLSSGLDKGKNFEFVKNAIGDYNLKILDGKNPLPYKRYLEVFGKAKAIVFNINANKKSSSDLSGTTASFEALLIGKPIFINYQPWLKELLKENYYVYKNEKELRDLCKKKIKFKKIDYNYLTLDHFTKRLSEIIEGI